MSRMYAHRRGRPWAPVPQTRSSARQNASPTVVVQCHGARTKPGPRGGGRLRVLSTVALAPTSIVCFTGAPGHPRPFCAHVADL